ncbi:TlpA disulfide reductase family protein [Methylophilus sp. 14]|uniref:TlpA family protein disulfide reductase n=1 Tax=Methylophilus sp. 14 TaxID=2781019 RepID=UPI00188F39EF|nr:TlpA disulfide reductase family protein [Methylophilus sp. 14]MBF4988885.1 TlpA family protein disulfide reductase [Methylophilus sp. 14]
MRNVARVVMTVLLMVVLGSGFRWLYLNRDQWMASDSALPSAAQIAPLWAATLFDHSGKAYPLAQYQGKPVILNFWATWCEPCREEMPEISALAKAHPEIVVLGLAIDEAAAVHEFTESSPVSYPLLIAENEGMPLAETLGNHKGVLPYTVIISAQGEVTQIFFGRVNREMLQKALNL